MEPQFKKKPSYFVRISKNICRTKMQPITSKVWLFSTLSFKVVLSNTAHSQLYQIGRLKLFNKKGKYESWCVVLKKKYIYILFC